MNTLIKSVTYTVVFLCSSVQAQVVTDGTVGVVKHLSGNMIIPQSLGTTKGTNLFHSFKTFNINSGESATFTGSDNLKNVISRVTGGNFSMINGSLTSEIGNANFYFINPAGITFGVNAQVDVPAAFHVTTAQALRFADEAQFSATDLTASSLTIAEPISFGFLGNQGDINIKGSQLSFANGNNVSFSAGNLVIDAGVLTNSDGKLGFYAMGTGNAEIKPATISNTNLSGKLEFDNSKIYVDYMNGEGRITMQAGDVRLKNSELWLRNNGDIDAKGSAGITTASDNITVDGGALVSANYFTGNAANIEIDSQHKLAVKNGSFIANASVNMDAANAGNASNINVTADKIVLSQGGQIVNTTFGNGNAGDIAIDAKRILIDKQAGIFTDTSKKAPVTATGNAGNIKIGLTRPVHNLTLNNGLINSSTNTQGIAGDISINADNVVVDNHGIKNSGTGIGAQANEGSSGQVGNITINSAFLTVKRQGVISISSFAKLSDAQLKQITPTTLSINVGNFQVLDDGQIYASAGNPDGTGNVQASAIHINAVNTMVNDSVISTEAQLGSGGPIDLKGDVTILRNGQITTSVKRQGGDGGNIDVDNQVLVLDGGFIQANTQGINSSGGDININIDSLVASNNQLEIGGVVRLKFEPDYNIIQAASPSGLNGDINITAPQVDLSGSISGLSSAKLLLPNVAKNPCAMSGVLNSSLVSSGQGGIPIKESDRGFVPPTVMPVLNSTTEATTTVPISGNVQAGCDPK